MASTTARFSTVRIGPPSGQIRAAELSEFGLHSCSVPNGVSWRCIASTGLENFHESALPTLLRRDDENRGPAHHFPLRALPRDHPVLPCPDGLGRATVLQAVRRRESHPVDAGCGVTQALPVTADRP